jgi:hypothetical protein
MWFTLGVEGNTDDEVGETTPASDDAAETAWRVGAPSWA